MRAHRFEALALLLSSAFGLAAPALAGAGDTAPPHAIRILSIREIDSRGRSVPRSCLTAVPSCSADIASTLVVTPDLEPVSQRLLETTQAPPPLPDATREAREALKEALASLERSSALSLELRAELERRRSSTPEGVDGDSVQRIRQLNAGFEKERRNAYAALLRYAHAEPEQFGLDARTLENDDDTLVRINERVTRDELGAWIAARAAELQREARASASEIRAAAPALLLRLAAFRVRRGAAVAVHLPGYDSVEARAPRDFDRITTSLTAAQRARLEEEARFTRDVIRSATVIVTEGRTAAADLEQTRRELAAGLSAARAELRTLLPALKADVVDALQGLASDVAANPALAPRAEAVGAAHEKARKLLADLERVKDALGVLEETLRGDPGSEGRPDLLLARLLGAVEELKASAKSALSALETLPATVRGLVTAVSDLGADPAFQEAFASRLAGLKQVLARDLEPSVGKVIAESGTVGALLRDGAGLLSLLRNQMTLVSNSRPLERIDLSSPAVFSIPQERVVPTQLEVLRTDAEDGDRLEIVAEVRSDPSGEPIHEERLSVAVHAFGWSSDVSGGLIFVKSIDVDTSNFKPEPVATWRIGYRPRPEDGSFGAALGRALRPGLGIHVATLGFSNDTSVEMGAGVNVHLFSDLVQLGYGWNLTIKENRTYWYLGIGLFELLKVVK